MNLETDKILEGLRKTYNNTMVLISGSLCWWNTQDRFNIEWHPFIIMDFMWGLDNKLLVSVYDILMQDYRNLDSDAFFGNPKSVRVLKDEEHAVG